MANHEQTIENRLLLWIADWLTAALLSVGMVFPCLSAYGISGEYGFDFGAVLACCVFGSLAAALLFTWRHGYWGALALLSGGGLAFWRLWVHLKDDWRLVRAPGLSDLFDKSSAALFLLYGLVILTLGWVVVRVRAWWLAAALTVLPLLPAIGAGVLPSWPAMLAGFAGWGSMLLTDLFNKKDSASGHGPAQGGIPPSPVGHRRPEQPDPDHEPPALPFFQPGRAGKQPSDADGPGSHH